MFFTIRLVF